MVVATARYVQTDTGSGRAFTGVSEMLHVESGMASALDKPVLVFVQKGVDVGSFIQGVTQYVIIPDGEAELRSAWPRIHSYMLHARRRIQEQRESKSLDGLKKFGVGTLAVLGAIGVARSLLSDESSDDYDDDDDDFDPSDDDE